MSSQTFLVGTGVNRIYACRLTSDGQFELLNETKSGKGSTWLLPRDDLLYVVNEHDDKIETFTIDDRNQGKLTLKNTISSIGDTPCALEFDPSGKWLLVSNYGDKGVANIVSLPLNDAKYPDEKGAQITAIEGDGPHPTRQKHSYCHHAIFHDNYLYVVDLGSDTLSTYRFDATTGKLDLVGDRVKTEAGAGPRHILFHPTKPLAFVCNELNSTANVFSVDSSSGQLHHLQTIGTRQDKDQNSIQENYTAELQFTPDGKYLLVSNRGDENLVIFNMNVDAEKEVLNVKEHLDCHDSIQENYTAELQFTPDGKYLLVSNRGDENLVIFNMNVDAEKEVLNVKEHLDCHGSFTRYFMFDPTKKFLLVANQKSNNLVCFSYNYDNGTYTFVSQLDNIESPQHIVFLNDPSL
ncbi:unnamed protein product [Adineta ricciae]|uniref:6-phosphogluconolactonase n=1 Tax=Adineta ricciae TaxID=249248 RepID=A0A813PYX9_ADIRI|nr:unnamed protein product [Adineta ricciae]